MLYIALAELSGTHCCFKCILAVVVGKDNFSVVYIFVSLI